MKRFIVSLLLVFCSVAHADTETINWYMGDNVYATTTCESGGDITLPTAPTKYGYTFQGWNGYRRIEYIESTGRQYINTGVMFSGTKVEVDLKFSPQGNVNHRGAYAFTGTEWNFTVSNVAPGKLCFYHGSINGAARTDLHIDISVGSIYVLDMIQENNLFTYRINGVENSVNTTINYTVDYPYILFGTAYGNSLGRELSAMKLYYAKIYKNDVLIRDMIPVLDANNVPCMYDKVSQQFFYNSGTSDFIAGPVVNE